VAPSFCLLLIRLMDAFLCIFSSEFITSFISQLFFGIQNSSNQFARWRLRFLCCLFSLWMYFSGFFPPIFVPFSNVVSAIFVPINSSHKFPRWRYHSVYSLFSYWTHFMRFFLEIFRLKRSHRFARWRHRYIGCLYSFSGEFLCVFVVF